MEEQIKILSERMEMQMQFLLQENRFMNENLLKLIQSHSELQEQVNQEAESPGTSKLNPTRALGNDLNSTSSGNLLSKGFYCKNVDLANVGINDKNEHDSIENHEVVDSYVMDPSMDALKPEAKLQEDETVVSQNKKTETVVEILEKDETEKSHVEFSEEIVNIDSLSFIVENGEGGTTDGVLETKKMKDDPYGKLFEDDNHICLPQLVSTETIFQPVEAHVWLGFEEKDGDYISVLEKEHILSPTLSMTLESLIAIHDEVPRDIKDYDASNNKPDAEQYHTLSIHCYQQKDLTEFTCQQDTVTEVLFEREDIKSNVGAHKVEWINVIVDHLCCCLTTCSKLEDKSFWRKGHEEVLVPPWLLSIKEHKSLNLEDVIPGVRATDVLCLRCRVEYMELLAAQCSLESEVYIDKVLLFLLLYDGLFGAWVVKWYSKLGVELGYKVLSRVQFCKSIMPEVVKATANPQKLMARTIQLYFRQCKICTTCDITLGNRALLVSGSECQEQLNHGTTAHRQFVLPSLQQEQTLSSYSWLIVTTQILPCAEVNRSWQKKEEMIETLKYFVKLNAYTSQLLICAVEVYSARSAKHHIQTKKKYLLQWEEYSDLGGTWVIHAISKAVQEQHLLQWRFILNIVEFHYWRFQKQAQQIMYLVVWKGKPKINAPLRLNFLILLFYFRLEVKSFQGGWFVTECYLLIELLACYSS